MLSTEEDIQKRDQLTRLVRDVDIKLLTVIRDLGMNSGMPKQCAEIYNLLHFPGAGCSCRKEEVK